MLNDSGTRELKHCPPPTTDPAVMSRYCGQGSRTAHTTYNSLFAKQSPLPRKSYHARFWPGQTFRSRMIPQGCAASSGSDGGATMCSFISLNYRNLLVTIFARRHEMRARVRHHHPQRDPLAKISGSKCAPHATCKRQQQHH